MARKEKRSELDRGFNKAKDAGGGIVPGANAKAAEDVPFGNPIAQVGGLVKSLFKPLPGPTRETRLAIKQRQVQVARIRKAKRGY
jgi:hypothetical protein